MDKTAVVRILEEIGTFLELRGENPFKSRAFHNASRIVASLTENLAELVESGELRAIKGIGSGLSEKITELVKTGKLAYYEELRSSFPEGLLHMLRVPGLGPKRVRILYEKLGIRNIQQLEEAASAHRLSTSEGFGAKTEENILRGIEQLKKHSGKSLYSKARDAADRIVSRLEKHRGVLRCEVAGSVRRHKEIIGDIDILVSAEATAITGIMKSFVTHAEVDSVEAQGETKASVILKSGIHCDLRVVSNAEYPFALAYFTGSKEHNIELRSIAKKFGWSLNEYGFSPLGKGKGRTHPSPLTCRDEESIYRAIGLAYIPPELRENMGEVEAAGAKRIPRLVEQRDIMGTFHCHTTYSDGTNTLEEMAKTARDLGWKYLGIADHSTIAVYAGGLTEERVKQQRREIENYNSTIRGFRLFTGTEVDILPDGSLDWSDRILAGFDYVVASIHSKFTMTESEATKRIIKALKNKYVTMLGHPTGRLLLEREGYPVNMAEVINAASDYGKCIEINAHPMRLDLDWRWCRHAKDKGVMISINPDAHAIDGLSDVRFGVGIARKGWLEKKDILNTRSVRDVERYFDRSVS